MNKGEVHIRDVFFDFFSIHHKMIFGKMYFRLYNPSEDCIAKNYTLDDWNKIFTQITEEDLRSLNECVNVVILLWCDSLTDMAHGMLYLQESYPIPGEISFHGGTWDHNPVFFKEIFRSLSSMFLYLFQYCSKITTTCGIKNKQADKFQRGFGFIETYVDQNTSYKHLNRELFEKTIIAKRFKSNIRQKRK